MNQRLIFFMLCSLLVATPASAQNSSLLHGSFPRQPRLPSGSMVRPMGPPPADSAGLGSFLAPAPPSLSAPTRTSPPMRIVAQRPSVPGHGDSASNEGSGSPSSSGSPSASNAPIRQAMFAAQVAGGREASGPGAAPQSPVPQPPPPLPPGAQSPYGQSPYGQSPYQPAPYQPSPYQAGAPDAAGGYGGGNYGAGAYGQGGNDGRGGYGGGAYGPVDRPVVSLNEASWTYQPPPPVRVFRKNDVVTIRVDEITRMMAEGVAEQRKRTLTEAILTDWIRLDDFWFRPDPQEEGDPAIAAESNNNYRAESAVESRESLTFNIAATVVDIRPNGNLVLEARKAIRVNDNLWETSLSGICRAEDIAPDNVVLSKDLIDLEIRKEDRGHLRDGYSRGWLQRFVDRFGPF